MSLWNGGMTADRSVLDPHNSASRNTEVCRVSFVSTWHCRGVLQVPHTTLATCPPCRFGLTNAAQNNSLHTVTEKYNAYTNIKTIQTVKAVKMQHVPCILLVCSRHIDSRSRVLRLSMWDLYCQHSLHRQTLLLVGSHAAPTPFGTVFPHLCALLTVSLYRSQLKTSCSQDICRLAAVRCPRL